ncbi:aldehyde dehydrogenase family protein [Longimicrobium sp.]|uniref:aldehyde dehydrogenase family protein n=1 Tax=Longimicrobium sp. TaxID=2029185 RepID=UPI002B51EF3D|nr:aldehyde dehydrogenase family protein [Longimicrobium sp.]HSU16093.1 aldehyde dehydrogenase family protein [Longimicrobium sp.]
MLQVVNPATEEVIRELDEDTPETLRQKAGTAREHQPAWAARPVAERVACARRFGELLAAEADHLAATLTSEMGKPIRQARGELSAMAARIGFFAEQTERAVADEVVQSEGTEERIRWEPLGVVANISAWNYPYFVGSNVFLPALLTGNAVLYKPSEFATLTGLAIADLLYRAGIPREVFAPVVGAGPVGASLLEQRIDGVFFTGSYGTGRRIAETVAGRLIRVQLELGGKDPAYVCDDVDVAAAAAATAEGAFYNAGQSCCAVERVYVHRSIAREFTEAFVEAVRGYAVGDPADEATYVGPLARRPQLDVLREQVDDAVRRGATLLAGGRAREGRGWFWEPTVLAGATHEMKVMRDETFGPVIGIMEVEGDEDAVRRMNDTEYGLTAAVYTPDRDRAERVLRQVDAGTVYWNCCDRVSPRLPWTGRRHSGIGSTLGTIGIRAFVQPKAYHLNPTCGIA